MDLDSLLRSEWFYSSPGPISLIYYAILILFGAYFLVKRVEYRRFKWLNALTESFFLNGFIILSGDLIWILICACRFLPFYPDNLFLVVCVSLRDFVGMILCFLLVGNHIRKGVIKFGKNTFMAYLLLIGFLLVDFGMATTPAWTDWTFAVRQGYSTSFILASLFFSYGLGKVFSTVLWWSWWKPKF